MRPMPLLAAQGEVVAGPIAPLADGTPFPARSRAILYLDADTTVTLSFEVVAKEIVLTEAAFATVNPRVPLRLATRPPLRRLAAAGIRAVAETIGSPPPEWVHRRQVTLGVLAKAAQAYQAGGLQAVRDALYVGRGQARHYVNEARARGLLKDPVA